MKNIILATLYTSGVIFSLLLLVTLCPYLLGITLIHFDISSFPPISPEESKMMKLFLIYVQGIVYAGFIAVFIGMSFVVKNEIKDLWNYYYKKVKSK